MQDFRLQKDAGEVKQVHSYSTRLRAIPDCDVIVAGGGVAGVYAALAAADAGANTVLVEQHGFVGGQGTAGGVHTFCGETRVVNNAWRNMIERLRELESVASYRPNHDGRAFGTEALKFVLQEMLNEAGVRLLLHTSLVDVERSSNRVEAVILFNKSGLQRLACAQAIDATGDADLVARGCWEVEKGGPVFLPGESPQPDETAAPMQLPMSLYFAMLNTRKLVKPYRMQDFSTWNSDDDLPMITIHGDDNLIVVKMKVIGHDATDGESLSHAEQAARRQMMAVVEHLQTKGYKSKTYETYRLAWVAPHIGIREGRRIIAEYQLTVDDVLEGRHFEDAIAVGSYHVDYHWPTVVQRAGTGLTTQAPPYQIPLRAMRPRASTNLLVPGRCLSGEQMAMSSFRVMGICAQTGFAAGTAAGLAATQGKSLDEVSSQALQESLRQRGVRLDLAPYMNYLRARRAADEPVFERSQHFQQCHASTLAVLPNGDIICAWFAGTEEGANDVAIWAAIRHEERWGEPFEVIRHPGIPTWNPVLFMPDMSRLFAEPYETSDAEVTESNQPPRLLLYYRAGEHPTSWYSFVMESADGGRSWSEPVALPDGVLGPIRNKPIKLADGVWLSGSSVETASEWYCQMERSEGQGKTWTVTGQIRLEGHPRGLIQPTLWESTPGHVHALMRSRGVGRICRADSSDGGQSWGSAYETDLPNNNSGIDLAKLVPSPGDPGYDDSEPAPLALVFNPVTEGRTPLVIAVSYDNGTTWPDRLTLVDDPGEYSYPAIIPTSDGIALTYTHDRKHIHFARYSLEQLRGEGQVETAPGVGHHEGREWLEHIRKAQD